MVHDLLIAEPRFFFQRVVRGVENRGCSTVVLRRHRRRGFLLAHHLEVVGEGAPVVVLADLLHERGRCTIWVTCTHGAMNPLFSGAVG